MLDLRKLFPSNSESRVTLWAFIITLIGAVGKLACSTWSPITYTELELAQHLENGLQIYVGEWILYGGFLVWLFRQPYLITFPSLTSLVMMLIISRVSWWTAPPSPSEDVWRYLWDGQQFIFASPVFSLSPEAIGESLGENINQINSRGVPLGELLSKVGHKEHPTVYPPGAQLFFGGVALFNRWFEGGLLGALLWWRGLLLVTELYLLIVLKRLSDSLKLNSSVLLCYVLCPLFAFESSLSAHLDIIGVTLMMSSLSYALQSRWVWAGGLLGLSISVKFVPMILTLAYLVVSLTSYDPLENKKYLKDKRSVLSLILPKTSTCQLVMMSLSSFMMTFFVFYEELSSLGWIWPGLKTYATHWSFNGSVYPLLEWGSRQILQLLEVQEPLNLRPMIKVISALGIWILGGWLLIYKIYKKKKKVGALESYQFLNTNLICLFSFLLLSPVVYSWYLLWIMPLAVILMTRPFQSSDILWNDRSAYSIAWVSLAWGGLCICTYQPRIGYLYDKVWYFSEFWPLMEYGTLVLTFVLMKRYTQTSR